MRIFIIADTHFGIYPIRSEKWLSMMNDWVYNFFIPTLKKYAKPGDIVMHLGDVYDNRTSINVKVLNSVVKIFDDISKILPVHILVGNHDMWAMSDTEINSISSIKYIPNIYTYTEPTIMDFDGRKCLLMPWVHKKNNEISILNNNIGLADVVFCHSDLNGARTQVNPTRPSNKYIPSINDFNGYKSIYSGHIHINQKIDNFTFVGAPYHLDRNDIGNEKGIYILDTKTLKDHFIKNTLSPNFNKIYITREEDIDTLDIDYINKNYVDLYINNSLIIKNDKFRLKVDSILSSATLESIDYVNDEELKTGDLQTDIVIENNKDFHKDIKHISKEWVETRKYYDDSEANEKAIKSINNIIDEAFNIHERNIRLAKPQPPIL